MNRKGSDRKEIIDRAVLDISKAAEKDQKAIPPGLEKVGSYNKSNLDALILNPYQKVSTWFQNNQQRNQDQRSKKSKKSKSGQDGRSALTWTMRRVVQEKFPKEIDALILDKDPEATRGSQGYIKLLHHTVSEFIKGLSEEQQQEYNNIANERNAEGVDSEIQAQWV